MILMLLLLACLPEIPTIWNDALVGSKGACSLIGRRAVESRHLRFLKTTASLGLARWLYPIDLSQLMNSATMIWTHLVGATSVAGCPAKWTNRIDNIFSPNSAIELNLLAGLALLTRWMFHLWTARSYIGLQTPHPSPNMGLFFFGIMAVISARSRSAVNRLS